MSRHDRLEGEWFGRELRDMRGIEFVVGDRVAKSKDSPRSGNIEVGTVTRIEAGKLYLDGSKVAIRYPSRLLIVTQVFA